MPVEDDRVMMRLGEIRTASNPYMNAYNHSRPQNISRVEGSFSEESPFTTSVFRTGHFVRPPQQDSAQETSLHGTELLDCGESLVEVTGRRLPHPSSLRSQAYPSALIDASAGA